MEQIRSYLNLNCRLILNGTHSFEMLDGQPHVQDNDHFKLLPGNPEAQKRAFEMAREAAQEAIETSCARADIPCPLYGKCLPTEKIIPIPQSLEIVPSLSLCIEEQDVQ